MSLIRLRSGDLDDALPLGDVAGHEPRKLIGRHRHRQRALFSPRFAYVRTAGDLGDLGVQPADDFARLKYTEMVLAEAMRLYPPAWTMGRQALSDYSIDNFIVPAGSIILMSPWVMHHDERYYPDAFRFDPERWTPAGREARPKFSYFPFGGGPRVCIGEGFAWMEGVLLIATIAERWRMRMAEGEKVEPRPMITLRPRRGIRMTLERRDAAIGEPVKAFAG